MMVDLIDMRVIIGWKRFGSFGASWITAYKSVFSLAVNE